MRMIRGTISKIRLPQAPGPVLIIMSLFLLNGFLYARISQSIGYGLQLNSMLNSTLTSNLQRLVTNSGGQPLVGRTSSLRSILFKDKDFAAHSDKHPSILMNLNGVDDSEITGPLAEAVTVMNSSGFSLTGWTHNTAPGIDGDCLVAPGYSGSICGGVGLAGALPANSPDGGNFIASDGNFFNHSISQLITGLTPSASYQLTFYQALAQDVEPGITVPGPVSGHWDVTFGSTTLSSAARYCLQVPCPLCTRSWSNDREPLCLVNTVPHPCRS